MLFEKKDQLIGLDIGSRSLKIAEIKKTQKNYKLNKFVMADIVSGSIEEGVIKKPKEIADSMRQLWNSYNIGLRNVAISVGSYSVIVKIINMPAMGEEQLQESIQAEAEQYIPFDISDVYLDFQVLGENTNNSNQMNILLVAAKKEIIDNYIDLVQMAGLNPCIVDVDAFALQNIYKINYETGNENIALIDIGASKISLNILKDNSSIFIRDVAFGSVQIDQKIVSLLDCSLEKAEKIKLSGQSDEISSEDLRKVVSSVETEWCNEIKRAFDFFYSNYPDDEIAKIVLSGGGANNKEFYKFLAEETSAKVETIDPFSSLYIDEDRFDSSYLKKIAPQASVSLGLANRKVDDK